MKETRRGVGRLAMVVLLMALAVGLVLPGPALAGPALAGPAADSVPAWAAEALGDLRGLGVIPVPTGNGQSDAEILPSSSPMTRERFMTLAVAGTGRKTAGWATELAAQGILTGRPFEGAALDSPIHRGEAVAFLIRLLRSESAWEDLWSRRPSEAVPASLCGPISGHWAEQYFLSAHQIGLVLGSPEAGFDPDGLLSESEGSVLLSRLLRCGEAWMPVEPADGAVKAVVAAAADHVRAFVEVFDREPYDFSGLSATTSGQAREMIVQNQDYYKQQYARGSRFKFELVSFEAEVTSRSLYLAKVRTVETMREYVNGKVSESEYGDAMTLRRIEGRWLVCR